MLVLGSHLGQRGHEVEEEHIEDDPGSQGDAGDYAEVDDQSLHAQVFDEPAHGRDIGRWA